MKILVRDDTGSALGAIQINIKDLSAELERITVRVFGLRRLDNKLRQDQRRALARKHSQSIASSRPGRPVPVPPRPASRRTPEAPQPSKSKTIEIKLSLPRLNLPSPSQIKRRLEAIPKRVLIITGAVCAVAIVATGIYYNNASGPKTLAANTTNNGFVLPRGTPSYPTVLPAGKNISELGGWARVSPPDKDPVYTYVDKINNVQINVSEQPLPANFRSNTAHKIEQLAHDFNATDKIATGDITLYIGTSAKGPQSVIFNKGNLLIMIKSTYPIADSQWAAYAASLQ